MVGISQERERKQMYNDVDGQYEQSSCMYDSNWNRGYSLNFVIKLYAESLAFCLWLHAMYPRESMWLDTAVTECLMHATPYYSTTAEIG
jgi:hypothetical protein